MVWLELVRVKHWVKNSFLFIPIFFAGQLFDLHKYVPLVLGFFAFSFIASGVYIFNDLRDHHRDALHPVKRNRPIPSGIVKRPVAIAIMIVLVSIGLSMSYFLNAVFFALVAAYLCLNAAYSLGLKNFSIVDIMIVSIGFVLRVYAGGVLATVAVSHWLAIMIFLLALFLALAKRRDDLLIGVSGEKVRKSISQYNLEFVNACLSVFAGIIIVSYILYTLSTETSEKFNSDWLFLTSIFVIAGIMRYLQIIYIDNNSGYPTSILFKDRFILFTLCGWIISFCLIIYLI